MRSHARWWVLAAMVVSVSACTTNLASRNGDTSDSLPTSVEQGEGARPREGNGTGALPASLRQQVQTLRGGLEDRGFEVAQGDWNLFTIEDCKYARASIGNCVGNNPAAPYIIPTVPLWPDEFVDENMEGLLGPTRDGNSWTYRLDEREALVVFGQLPPPGAYFGIVTYLFSREGTIDTTDEVYRQTETDPFMRSILFMASPNPSRVLVFSSVGDTINDVVIERQAGSAFGEQLAFIITPDAALARELTEQLVRAGVAERDEIFVEPVSPQLARLGLDEEADDLMTLIRYAQPEDKAAGDRWREQLPLTVLRVRDTNRDRAEEPYPLPVREERKARSELELKDEVENLTKAVKQQWGQPDAPDAQFESLLLKVDLIGEHCLKRPMNCLGDNSDADYQISPTVSLDQGEVIAVVGTLGTATDNATYVSLAPNWIPALQGVANVSGKDLKGSASEFSGNVDDTDKLYVQYFARDCGELSNCLEITEEMVPRGDALKVVQRNYVVPGTTRGPDPNLVVNPRLIVLDGNARPRGR